MRIAVFVSVLYLMLYGLDLLLLATLNRRWWRRRQVRLIVLATPPAALLLGALCLAGARFELYGLVRLGAGMLSALFLYLFGLLLALLITGLLHTGEQFYDRLRNRSAAPPSPARRLFLRRALASVPLVTSGMVTGGIVRASIPARMPQIPLRFPDLPPRLEGLRILHLTDIHLGPYVQLRDLEQLLERAAALQPDLVLATGDLCDHMPSYRDTLRLIEDLPAPLGTFASLGNHEYFRGIGQVRECFAQSTIPLLVDEGVSLQVGGQRLYLAGADDPRFLRTPSSYRDLRFSVEKAQDGAPADAFLILMSHRSQAFDYAAPLGVDLTLSGHTHGFQVGFGGRSLLETLMPERYVWGHYQKDDYQLYTSAGVGHWLPFRLGCPPEAPLYILHRKKSLV